MPLVACSLAPENDIPPPDDAADDDAAPETERSRVPLSATPSLAVTAEAQRFRPLDAREAHLLSLVDGRNTFAAILHVSDVDREEAFAVLESLLQAGVIELRGRIPYR